MNQPQNLLAAPNYGARHPQPVGPGSGGAEYRTSDYNHLAQHYGRDKTSAQLAQELGRPSAAAVRMYVSRHPELRRPKQ